MYPNYNPYAVLGLPVTAELAEIKRVFRQLAKQYHPDVNPQDVHAVARFQAINQAYELILSMKTSPQYPYYPPAYPYYPSAPPSAPSSAPPEAEKEFKTYAWEPIEMKEEAFVPKAQQKPQAKPQETEPEVPEKDYSGTPWREDLLQPAYEESFRDAKDRVLRKKFSPQEQLKQEIMVYLLRGKTRPPVRYSSTIKSTRD